MISADRTVHVASVATVPRRFIASIIVFALGAIGTVGCFQARGNGFWKETELTSSAPLYVVEGQTLVIPTVCHCFDDGDPFYHFNDCSTTTTEAATLSTQTATGFTGLTFGPSGDFSSANLTASVSGTASFNFTTTATDRSGNQGNRIGKVSLVNSYSHSTWTTERMVYVIENSAWTVGVTAITPSPKEGTTATFRFSRSAYFTSGDLPVTLTYSISGTASATDYSGLTGTATIPAGQASVDVSFPITVDTAIEGAETLTVTLNNDGFGFTSGAQSATMQILDDYPTIEVTSTDNYAAEAGTNKATFNVTRSGNLNTNLTVQLAYSGTAVAGTDYVTLPSSVTFVAGQTQTNITVTPLIDANTEPAETVVMRLLTNSAYFLGLQTNAMVLLAGEGPNPRDSYPKGERYYRGSGVYWTNYSVVIPMEGLKGTRRSDVSGVGTTLYHLNATNAGSQSQITNRIAFDTPLASFGSQWGTALYIAQPYHVTWFAGSPYSTSTNLPSLQVIAYYRSNNAVAGTMQLALPNNGNSNDWTSFVTNGFVRTVEGYGLRTSLRASVTLFTVADGWGTYVCTHIATPDATNYTYSIQSKGWSSTQPLVVDASSQSAYDPLYTLDFSPRPALRSLFLDQPHFAGQPLPSHLYGRTPQELLTYSAVVTNVLTNTALTWTNVDLSPELRRHPVLDQFVKDLNSNALALANYVFNEIELIDGMGIRDDGAVTNESINCGGINRNALGVYLEGQGSPIEQCSLLVYLLRQAGYPAGYVFPPDGGLKLLDSRVSQLLRFQVSGAQDEQSRYYTTNRLIAVNYPWVAVYVNGAWVHLFPWLKDTEVIEGFDLYDFLPDQYRTTQLWVKDYVRAKTNILAYADLDDDTPLVIYPRFLTSVLATNSPGLSIDDLGMRYRNRRHLYSQWTDFPRPTVLTNVFTAVDGLASTAITNVSPRLTNLFDTVSIELVSDNNPTKKTAIADLRMCDLHNRRFFLTHTNTGGSNYSAQLILSAFSTNSTGVGTFTTTDTALTNRQSRSLALNDLDDSLTLRFRYRRQRALPWETPLDPDRAFLLSLYGTVSREVVDERYLRKGDVAAICMTPGRVSPAMLRQHAQDLWAMEQKLSTNSASASQIPIDTYQGSLLYLMGMNYYERQNRFEELNMRLHKIVKISTFAVGLAKLGPRRDTNNVLVAGAVDPVWPNVDMLFVDTVSAGNGTARPDSGWDYGLAYADYSALNAADSSAQEHQILNQYFGQSNAVSTVKLLQLAEKSGAGIVELTSWNYVQKGNTLFGSTKLKDFNASLWNSVAEYFQGSAGLYSIAWITPSNIVAPGGFFQDMAALVLSPSGNLAAIGANQRGGFADQLPNGTVSTTTLAKWETRVDADGDYKVTTTDPTSSAKRPASEVTATFDVPSDNVLLTGNAFYVNPNQDLQGKVNGAVYNGTPGTYLNLYDDTADLGNAGKPDNKRGFLTTMADPVNTLTGEFYIDETDLVLPGPMPLQLRRNYGSQNLAANQLGFGWKLDYMPYLTVAPSNNIIYAAEMDGSVLAFGLLGTNLNLWAPSTKLNPNLNNQSTDGIGGLANRLNARLLKTVLGGTNTYYLTNADGSVRIFQEMSFPLSATIDRLRPYLTTWYDNRSNYYRFEYGTDVTQTDFGQVRRIVSSSGNILRLQYDVYARIVDAFSLDGRHVLYDYDSHGDLVGVTRPDMSEIHYEYQLSTWVTNSVTNVYSTHLLTRELKPDGRILQNDYDSLRRVTNQYATAGANLALVRNATFRYTNNFSLTNLTNTLTGTTTVLDWTNNVYTYFYTNGLIRRILDPLNQEVVQAWYEESETNAPAFPRSLKTSRDKRGLVTSYQYDGSGNATNVTVQGDILGDGNTNSTATAVSVYNANGLPTVTVSPSGTTNLFFYTNSWLLSRVEVWPLNATVTDVITNQFTYGFSSNSADGTVAYGLKVQEIRAANSSDAATNEWTYDSHGYVTLQTRYTGTSDPAVTVSNLFNSRGELVLRADALGRTTRFTYDPNGKPESREVYEAGQSTPMFWEDFYYNENGELTWTDGPRFDPEDYVYRDYDGAGRKVLEIHWRSRAKADGSGVEAETGDNLYAVSRFDYDPFGNLTRTIEPRGVVTTNTYDALGKLLSRTVLETNGVQLTAESFLYAPGGEVTNYTNPLGGVTRKQYNQAGKQIGQNNADGSTNGWLYYSDGRLKREFQVNGAYWETTYNDAARRMTRIFYSAGTTPLATNVAEFDRRGNLVRKVDAAGNAFTNLYDGLDRLKASFGPVIVSTNPFNFPPSGPPMQQVTTYAYDAAGQTTIVSNALREAIITVTDALGRQVSQAYVSSNAVVVRTNYTLYAANHHSFTTYEGSGSSAIARTFFTDNDGRSVLAVRYPNANLAEFTLQKYDLVGNRLELRECSWSNNVVSTWATNLWAFDGLSRTRSEIVRDGATTLFGYDAMGNLTNRTMPAGLTWSAGYGSDGHILQELDSAGGSTTRTVTYSYYPSGNALAGRLQTMTDGAGVTATVSYDDWLRVSTKARTGSLAEQQLTTTWSYDARGFATNITETFSTNTTAPPVGICRSYNPYGTLEQEVVQISGTNASDANQMWDSAGRRSGLSFQGFGYQFGWQADGLLASVTGSRSSYGGVYTYDTAGQLLTRTVGSRVTSIDQRDGVGRPLSATTATSTTTQLAESMSYREDGLLVAHTVERTSDLLNEQTFAYGAGSRRLVEERLNTSNGTFLTNSFGYDGGQAGQLGVMRQAGSPGTQWTGALDAFARVAGETNPVMNVFAVGRVNGPSTLSALLDSRPVPITAFTNSGNVGLFWQASLELGPGGHSLRVDARHPSTLYTATSTKTFTNNAAPQTVTNGYNNAGQLTAKVWFQGTNIVRTKTLKWDGRGRLFAVSERDSLTSGYDWSALYDGFNRRVLTKTVVWTNGVSLSSQPTVLQQYFDPEVEFLEVGVAVNGHATWKLYGPDLSGRYGGMGGVGGLEAIAPPPDLFCPVLSDLRGNIQGAYDQRHGGIMWMKSRVTGYGAVPGCRPMPIITGQAAEVAASSAWRGCWPDVTGYYWLGMRYYDPTAGRWLSDDSLGHEADAALQTFCGGDPINRFDPDGRFAKKAVDYGGNAFIGFTEVWTGYDPGQPTSETGYYGRVGGRNAAGALASFLTIKGGGDVIGGGFVMAGSATLELGSGGVLTVVAAPGFAAGAEQALWGTVEFGVGSWGLHNFNNLEPLQNPGEGTKGGLHPDAGPYKDPTPPEYEGGYSPDELVKDHLDSRAHGGLDVPENIDMKPRQSNAIKGGREGQLLRYEQYLRDHGMSEADVKQVTADEWKSINNDVHGRSTDPHKLDKLPAPGSDK